MPHPKIEQTPPEVKMLPPAPPVVTDKKRVSIEIIAKIAKQYGQINHLLRSMPLTSASRSQSTSGESSYVYPEKRAEQQQQKKVQDESA